MIELFKEYENTVELCKTLTTASKKKWKAEAKRDTLRWVIDKYHAERFDNWRQNNWLYAEDVAHIYNVISLVFYFPEENEFYLLDADYEEDFRFNPISVDEVRGIIFGWKLIAEQEQPEVAKLTYREYVRALNQNSEAPTPEDILNRVFELLRL